METTWGIFVRFLRFGILAWGGPVAQIAMIRSELVERAGWVERSRFDRVLAVYQALPGPEAHELCVYLGHARGGRRGGMAAGLGFMLPGFLLMLLFSWVYVRYGIEHALVAGTFAGFAPAVAALVLRAVHRIGGHALHDRWLLAIALVAAGTQVADVPFAIPLVLGGLAYAAVARGNRILGVVVLLALVAASITWAVVQTDEAMLQAGPTQEQLVEPSHVEVATAGLRAGLLTFGGAYTSIAFVEHDAVDSGRWITRSQLLEGLAIGASLPAPLIIFATFVGYVGSGPVAALIMTFTIFAPAFAFTLLGHRHLERLVDEPRLHALLDGVTASVVGLMLVTAISLTIAALTSAAAIAIIVAALVVLHRWKARVSIVAVMLASGAVGAIAALVG